MVCDEAGVKPLGSGTSMFEHDEFSLGESAKLSSGRTPFPGRLFGQPLTKNFGMCSEGALSIGDCEFSSCEFTEYEYSDC